MENKLGYYEGESEYNNVCSFLQKHLSTIPDQMILSWASRQDIESFVQGKNEILPHQSIDVKTLYHLVGTVAHEFKIQGIKKGDRSILFVPMSVNMYVAMFALQQIGAIPVFLDSWARKDQLAASVQDVSPTSIISFHEAYQFLSVSEEIKKIPIKIITGPKPEGAIKTYQGDLDQFMKTQNKCPIEPVEKEHTALITFTTGSSGRPKGANRTHRFLAAQHYALNRHLPYDSTDIDMPVFPIFSLNNLAAGVHTVLPAIDLARPSELDAHLLYHQIIQQEINCTTLSPSLLNKVSGYCNKKGLVINNLRRIITGGAPVSNDDIEQMHKASNNTQVLVLYGSTEVEPMAHITGQEMLSAQTSGDKDIVQEGVNVGKMDDGLEYKIISINKENILIKDEAHWQQVIKNDEKVGEIIVAGEHVCLGYYNNKEAFLKAKIKDPDGIIWHRTGDLGYVDDNKDLWLVGRVHNAILTKQGWSFPVRAEIVLKKVEGVKHAAYLGIKDDPSQEYEQAVCVYSTQGSQQDPIVEDNIKKLLDKNNIIYSKIIYQKEIPLDPRHHSKVEYAKLREMIKSQ